MDLRDLMTLAGLVNPELLNKLQPTAEPECGCGSMEEETDGAGFDQSTTRPEPEVMDDPMATMGSGVDNSLRRYLKAKGDHVTVDESDLYPDLTVENVAEAYSAYKKGKKPVDENDVEEGNAYSGALAKAKAAGEDEFEVDGKTHKVRESDNKKPDEDGDGVPDWADKKPGQDDNEEDEEVDESIDILKKLAGLA